jgi:predicted lipid carrier protein YhbT
MRGHLPPFFADIGAALPVLPIELVARRLIANAMAARPWFAQRLAGYARRTFAIDPVDCPFAALITPGRQHPSVRIVRDLAGETFDARVAAPLIVLLGMIDGTYDGDALFFSRDLTIEGDTEAVLALRNALENAELDPATVIGLPQPLHDPFNRMTAVALDRMRQWLGAPEPIVSRPGIPSP